MKKRGPGVPGPLVVREASPPARYGPGGKLLAELLIVRSDRSHLVVVEPAKPFVSSGVKVADHETDFVVFTETVVWLFVLYGAVASLNVPSTVPVQLLLS